MALQGSALALGDSRACLLDEFGKVNNEDRYEIRVDVEFKSPQYQIIVSYCSDFSRVIILEGMERRSICSKPTLQADRCSVISAANPVEGNFNCLHANDTDILYLQTIRTHQTQTNANTFLSFK
jgi:DNA replicative helicase MCM subunit Mcm2 (Cdc46/Mcm family)